jgi:hypothetical protein
MEIETGETITANALTHQADIQEHFQDGLLLGHFRTRLLQQLAQAHETSRAGNIATKSIVVPGACERGDCRTSKEIEVTVDGQRWLTGSDVQASVDQRCQHTATKRRRQTRLLQQCHKLPDAASGAEGLVGLLCAAE